MTKKITKVGEVRMSKKSYKRNQNRLYREIKRRIIAESKFLKPVQLIKCDRKVETIKVREILSDCIEQTEEYIEFVKSDMTRQIVKKLVEDDYVKFNYSGNHHNIAEIEATLNVVKPFI